MENSFLGENGGSTELRDGWNIGPGEAFALAPATHLTQVLQPVLLRYPLGCLLAGSDPDGPVVGVNRRPADLDQRSEPHRAKKHPLESRDSSGQAELHLRGVSLWRAGV